MAAYPGLTGDHPVTGRDRPARQQFYARLFDWSVADAGDSSGYGLVTAAAPASAMVSAPARTAGRARSPSTSRSTIRPPILARAEQLGAHAVVQPTEIPNYGLTFALFTDPEGHVVGLSKGIDHS